MLTLLMIVSILFAHSIPMDQEWIFNAYGEKDTAVFHEDDLRILVNLPKPEQESKLEHYMRQQKMYNNELILLNVNDLSCEYLLNTIEKYDIKQIYIPAFQSESCKLLNSNVNLNQIDANQKVSITDHFELMVLENENETGNYMFYLNEMKLYWYESLPNNMKEATDIIYIPSYIHDYDLREHFFHQLNPEIALVYVAEDPKRNKVIHQMLMESWIEGYFIKEKLGIHLAISRNSYELYLEKLISETIFQEK
ncbi:hypothetical protein [Halalkalibacillus halophilus]|uniref:hypothetical protein n=1 Tax=Halalkalibacillus halophilus TaxID=392827 RepID=UPI000418AB1E|nr:hypothetical protein [Halalkalibacillus halophilus]